MRRNIEEVLRRRTRCWNGKALGHGGPDEKCGEHEFHLKKVYYRLTGRQISVLYLDYPDMLKILFGKPGASTRF
jgi:hypothetical protein